MLSTFAAILMLGAVAACGSTSPYSGYVTASNADLQQVEQGRYNENATAQIALVQNPDFNGGKISVKALVVIEKYAISCQHQIDPQAAGGGQSAAYGAGSYGAAGAGYGPAAKAAFPGAVLWRYTVDGMIAYILPGAVNGLYSGSYSMSSAKGTCTRDFWEDVVNSDPVFKGTHVEVIYAGKAWGGSVPPALDPSAVIQNPPLAPPNGPLPPSLPPNALTPGELNKVGPNS